MMQSVMKNGENIRTIQDGYLAADLPCPVCLVKNDGLFTLEWANEWFFHLFGFGKEEERERPSSLQELWKPYDIRTLSDFSKNGENGGAACFRHKITGVDNTERWLLTKISAMSKGPENYLWCISIDISESMRIDAHLKSSVTIARQRDIPDNLEIFRFDPSADTAQFVVSRSILTPLISMERTECHNFSEQLTERWNIHQEDRGKLQDLFHNIPPADMDSFADIRITGENGRRQWYRFSMTTRPWEGIAEDAGYPVTGMVENITRQKEADIDYLNETQFFQALLGEEDAYAQVDVTENRIKKAGGIWNIYNEIIDKVTFSGLFDSFLNKVVYPDDRAHYAEVMTCENFIQSFERGITRLGCEFRRILEQNKMVWMALSVYLFREPFTHHIIGLLCIKNIDKKKKEELSLLHSSEHDSLTNILHKKAAEHAIQEYLRQAKQSSTSALMIFDLDNFKLINDHLGHNVGDRVLVKFVEIVKSFIRRGDVLGRFGGDEFIAFLKDAESKEYVVSQLEQLFERLRDEKEPEISCSIGVTLLHGSALYERAFRQADAALYAAKSNGKSTYAFYEDEKNVKDNHLALICQKNRQDPLCPTADSTDFDGVVGDSRSFEDLLFEEGDMAYLVDAETFSFLKGNKAFYQRIGMAEAQCSGMRCYEVIQKRNSPCPFCSKANCSTDKFYMWRNYNQALEQEFLVKSKLVQWNDSEAMLSIAVDISNDKSIVDSLDNGMEETHCLLSGIQQMSEAESLSESMFRALETIGIFFQAESVRLWEKNSINTPCRCASSWFQEGHPCRPLTMLPSVCSWIETRRWIKPIMIENPEHILLESYDMYQFMKENDIHNQRWFRIKATQLNPIYLSVDNICRNFENVSFLESFCVFIANELKKRYAIGDKSF